MTSHEYAEKLRELAMHLELAESFKLPNYQEGYHQKYGMINFRYHASKGPFLAAVKAVGAGTKQSHGEDDLAFICFGGLLHLRIQRDAVCRVVKPAQPAEYECEPLLSQAEEESING